VRPFAQMGTEGAPDETCREGKRGSWLGRGQGKAAKEVIVRQRSEAICPDVDGKRAKPRHGEKVMHFVQYGCKLFTFLRYFLAYFNTRLFKPNPSCYSD
jgi:hypothetical protein